MPWPSVTSFHRQVAPESKVRMRIIYPCSVVKECDAVYVLFIIVACIASVPLQIGTGEGKPIFDSLIWQPCLAIAWVIFRLQITKDRILEAGDWVLFSLQNQIYSRWQFSNKGFRFPGGFTIQ